MRSVEDEYVRHACSTKPLGRRSAAKMSSSRPGTHVVVPGDADIINGVRRQLLVGAVVLLAAAGCRSPTPQDNFDKWASRAVSADAVAARESAAHVADTIFAHLPVKPAVVTSLDSCVVGEHDLWHSDQYQFACFLDETRYVPVDGALLPMLVQIDAAVLATNIGLSASQPLGTVRYYFAHGGKDADGLQLPKPRLAYSGTLGVLTVDWHDPVFPADPAFPEEAPAPQITWPEVYRTQTPAVDLAKLTADHDNVIAIYLSQTYVALPWSTSD